MVAGKEVVVALNDQRAWLALFFHPQTIPQKALNVMRKSVESGGRCGQFGDSVVRRWVSLTGAIAATLALSACATQQRIVTKEVRIPVSTPCLTQSPGQTLYAADAVNLDGTIFDLVQALLIDREQRKVSELNLRAAIAGCTP